MIELDVLTDEEISLQSDATVFMGGRVEDVLVNGESVVVDGVADIQTGDKTYEYIDGIECDGVTQTYDYKTLNYKHILLLFYPSESEASTIYANVFANRFSDDHTDMVARVYAFATNPATYPTPFAKIDIEHGRLFAHGAYAQRTTASNMQTCYGGSGVLETESIKDIRVNFTRPPKEGQYFEIWGCD